MKGYSRLKDKKGVALESAIVFLISIFTFCFLLSSLSLLGHSQAKINAIRIENDLELDQIGELYLEYVNAVPLMYIPPATTEPTESTAAPEAQNTASRGGMMLLSGGEETQAQDSTIDEKNLTHNFFNYLWVKYKDSYNVVLMDSDPDGSLNFTLKKTNSEEAEYTLIEKRKANTETNSITFELTVQSGETKLMYISYMKVVSAQGAEPLVTPLAWQKY